MFKKNRKTVSRPSIFLFATEIGRSMMEYGACKVSSPLLNQLERGDGHPVIVIPGFMSSDSSTSTLRCFLEKLGYSTYGWELGRNYGATKYIRLLLDRLEDIKEQHDGESVSVIGWSLGGVYARELAKERPDLVRQVITLGSPFTGLKKSNNISWIYRMLNRGRSVESIKSNMMEKMSVSPPVPTTAIFSKGDGIVSWQYCMELEETEIAQNIQVNGSHLGLGHNPTVFPIIADRLAQDPNFWCKFEFNVPLLSRVLYPNLASA